MIRNYEERKVMELAPLAIVSNLQGDKEDYDSYLNCIIKKISACEKEDSPVLYKLIKIYPGSDIAIFAKLRIEEILPLEEDCPKNVMKYSIA